MKMKILSITAIALIVLALRLTPVFAHGGEDHGDEETQVKAVTTSSAITKLINADNAEIMVKYPSLKISEPAPIQVFITDFKTNKPVLNHKVSLNFVNAGKTVKSEASATNTPGLYQANITFENTGNYNLDLDISGSKVKGDFAFKDFTVTGGLITESVKTGNSWLLPVILILLALLVISAIYMFITSTKSEKVRSTL